MEKYKGQLYVVLSAILFGFMPLFTKITYQYGSNAYTTSLGRFFLGSMILLIIDLIKKEDLHLTLAQFKSISILAFLQGFTPVLLYLSYNYIDSGLSTTLHFTYPIFVMVFGLLLFHEKLERKQIICLILCITGIVCLYQKGSSLSTLGMIIAIASGILFSLYVVLLNKSHLENIPLFVMSFYVCFIASMMILLYSLFTHHLVILSDYRGYIGMLALAIDATVLAVVLFQKGVFLCGSVKASLLSTFEPLTSVFVGYLVYHEVITLKTGIGVGLILLSTLLLVMGGKDEGIC